MGSQPPFDFFIDYRPCKGVYVLMYVSPGEMMRKHHPAHGVYLAEYKAFPSDLMRGPGKSPDTAEKVYCNRS